MLVPRQPGSDIRNWAVGPGKKGMFVSSINRGVQDRWRSAARWTSIECRASAPFPGRLGGDGAEAATKDSGTLGRPYQAGTRFLGYKRRMVLIVSIGEFVDLRNSATAVGAKTKTL